MLSQDLTLQFDATGVPRDVVTVIDLDVVTDFAALTTVVTRRPDRIGIIGTATRPLPPDSGPLLSELTFTLVPHESEHPSTVAVDDPTAVAAAIVTNAAQAPRATVATLGLLAVDVPLRDGVVLESFAYSMLLGGPEFATWRQRRPVRPVPEIVDPVRITRTGDDLSIVLDMPKRRNAFNRQLRADLIEALRLVELDPTITTATITGNGPIFSSGGDFDEFGQATDLAAAHAVRIDQSAGLAVHRVADRVSVILHGACYGAGIEVPAFAQNLLARPGTTVCLPELGMGLIPGAGGTASIKHRIGPWRTAYMILSGASIDVDQSLRWGLIDALID